MLKTLIAVALTIIGPLILLAACYAASYIPYVKRKLEVDDNDSLLMKVCAGYLAIATCTVVPMAVLFLSIVLFNVIYGLL